MTGSPFDKLSRIDALRPRPGNRPAPGSDEASAERAMRLVRLLGAEVRRTEQGSHLGVIHHYPDPKVCDVGTRAAQLLTPNRSAAITDPGRWLFLDSETTGLSGGTGTYAFLVGIGWWDSGGFTVEQFFMRDHSEEPSLLLELSQRLAERRVLVTFNGKSFDWPLLETRFRMTRTAALESPEAHLDLLHPSRQLWKYRMKSVALSELEREVLALDRGPDIPSHTIPESYFNFVRGGPEGPIVDVFHHNAMDLRGLAALAVRIVSLLDESGAGAQDGGEIYGISRMLHRRGDQLLAKEGYQRALTYGLPDAADRSARRELALLAKRSGDSAAANALWESLLGDPAAGLHAHEQLAIHYEHRDRDPERALALTLRALVRLRDDHLAGRLDMFHYQKWHARLSHRMSRLQTKMQS